MSADKAGSVELAEPMQGTKSRMCAASNHSLCAAIEGKCHCACHRGAKPRNTLPRAAKAAAKPVVVTPLMNGKVHGKDRDPVIELVKANPPAKARKGYGRKHLTEIVRPLLEELLVRQDRDWYRCCLFFKAKQASMNVWRLERRYGSEWEWTARVLEEEGQSAIYVRWVGTKGEIL